MWLKPRVGTRFVAENVTTTNDTILATLFSLGERQNYVNNVASVGSQWPSQVQRAQQYYLSNNKIQQQQHQHRQQQQQQLLTPERHR